MWGSLVSALGGGTMGNVLAGSLVSGGLSGLLSGGDEKAMLKGAIGGGLAGGLGALGGGETAATDSALNTDLNSVLPGGSADMWNNAATNLDVGSGAMGLMGFGDGVGSVLSTSPAAALGPTTNALGSSTTATVGPTNAAAAALDPTKAASSNILGDLGGDISKWWGGLESETQGNLLTAGGKIGFDVWNAKRQEPYLKAAEARAADVHAYNMEQGERHQNYQNTLDNYKYVGKN